MKHALRAFLLVALLLGLLPLLDLIQAPGRPGFAMGVGLLLGLLVVLAYLIARVFTQPDWLDSQILRLDSVFLMPENMFWAFFWLVGPVLLMLYASLFTHLFLPSALRPVFLWLAVILLMALLVLVIRYRSRVFWPGFWLPLADLPDAARLDRRQRRVRGWLVTAGMVYFLIAGVVSSLGMGGITAPASDATLPVYSFVTQMLLPPGPGEEWAMHFFVDLEAPYGFPFYLLSALALLPMRLVGGVEYAVYGGLNLLFLRQLVSVLPVITAAALLAYMRTRFHARFQALAIFALLLLIPQAVTYNLGHWRPEGLMLLLVVLVLFLLEKDNLRFGINYRAAAAIAGVAAAVQFYGALLLLLFLGLLIAGLRRGTLTARNAGLLFARTLGIVIFTVALANPFLFLAPAREAIRDAVTGAVQQGDFAIPPLFAGQALSAAEGPGAHLRFLEGRFGSGVFLIFLLLSMGSAAVWGSRQLGARLILAWGTLLSVYLLFIAPGPPGHAWMVALLPLFSGAFALLDFIKRVPAPRWRRLFSGALVLILAAQAVTMLTLSGLELAQVIGMASMAVP